MTNDGGVAGSSARREYERRRANDEARIRERWGRLGGIAVALSDERPSTTAWRRGAVGEERMGRLLDSIASSTIRVLHDRRVPGTRGNLDHLVVTSGGVWIVDTKRYAGRVELRREGGLFSPRVSRLYVGGRDKTKLVDGMRWQQDAVTHAQAVPVFGALCFVEAEWSLFAKPFWLSDVFVTWPAKLAESIMATSGRFDVDRITAVLASRFPASRAPAR